MDHIGKQIAAIEQNIKINSADPVALHGFTQVPNFILKNPDISIGAKTTYALFLSYAWHNSLCFPGQDTLAKAIGMSIGSVNGFIKELRGLRPHRDHSQRAGEDQHLHHQLRRQAESPEVLISAG